MIRNNDNIHSKQNIKNKCKQNNIEK